MSVTNKTNNQPTFEVMQMASRALSQVCPESDPTSGCYSVNDLAYTIGENKSFYDITFKNREGNNFGLYCKRFGNKYQCSGETDRLKFKTAGCGGDPSFGGGYDVGFEVDVEEDSAGEEVKNVDSGAKIALKPFGEIAKVNEWHFLIEQDVYEDVLEEETSSDPIKEDVQPESQGEELLKPPVCKEAIQGVVTVTPGNGASWGAAISGDGQNVVFLSYANNLMDNDTNNVGDIFLLNIETGLLELVNNVDGSFDQVSPVGYLGDAFVNPYDAQLASKPENDQYKGELLGPAINYDGKYVVYSSRSKNLAAPIVDTTKGSDIFLYDRYTGKTKMISLDNNGQQPQSYYAEALNPDISDDGRFITFLSLSDYTSAKACGVHAYAYDDLLNTVFLLTAPQPNNPYNTGFMCDEHFNPATEPRLSGDGSAVGISASTIFYQGNTMMDSKGGDNANAYLSTPGAGHVTSINYNNDGGETYVEGSSAVTPNYDASLVSFESDDPNALGYGITLNGKVQIFVRDMAVEGGLNMLVSANEFGEEADADARRAGISGDGKWVVFDSRATNLIPGIDTHNKSQVYLKNIETDELRLISKSVYLENSGGSKMSAVADVNYDGSVVVFESDANDIVEENNNAYRDVFVYFTETDEVIRASQRIDYSEEIYEVCER